MPAQPQVAGPASGRGEPWPRSGVRERGSEDLDAVFEEQNLPLDALMRGRHGTTTPR
jgi:hypothetical protein